MQGALAQVVGDPLDEATTVGPLVSSRQRDRVERYIKRGTGEGAQLAVARRIDSGAIGINRFGIPSSTPFGGVKMSGLGREHGREGYDSFLEYRSYGYA